MTDKVCLILDDRNGTLCQFPHCVKIGELCTITLDDQTEGEVILCEKHLDVCRCLGQ